MERVLINELHKWKDKPDRKPLILRGARQVGKTWLLKDFGKKFFNNSSLKFEITAKRLCAASRRVL